MGGAISNYFNNKSSGDAAVPRNVKLFAFICRKARSFTPDNNDRPWIQVSGDLKHP